MAIQTTEDIIAERDMLQERVDQLEAVLRCIADDLDNDAHSRRKGGQHAGAPKLPITPGIRIWLTRYLESVGIGTR